MKATALALLALTLSIPAMAADKSDDASTMTSREVVRGIVRDSKPAPDGTVQPSTGRARPVENWFGCKPGPGKQSGCKKSENAPERPKS